MPPPPIHPLVISAPFGNYIRPSGTTPTLGTFTRRPRPGRLWRILKTVRYDPFSRAWINKIGLRNPGIDHLARRARQHPHPLAHQLISIHGFSDRDWYELLDITAALNPLAIELNMSCPNIGEVDWPHDLFRYAVDTATPVVVKLPPVNDDLLIDHALAAGIRNFHAANTLPIPAGGLSGKPLKPVALQAVRRLRQRAPDAFIIAGGGITTTQDIDEYARAGADRFAIATKCFNPLLLFTHAPLRALIQHARTRATACA